MKRLMARTVISTVSSEIDLGPHLEDVTREGLVLTICVRRSVLATLLADKSLSRVSR